MMELNEALVLAMRAELPTNATTLQTYVGQPAIFAETPVPDVVADNTGQGGTDPTMYIVLGPVLMDENPLDKGAELREILTQATVWALLDYNSAREVEVKAQEIITQLHRENAKLAPVAGYDVVLLEIQGITSIDVDQWLGRVVSIRVILDKT